jgi:hypothetical protein
VGGPTHPRPEWGCPKANQAKVRLTAGDESGRCLFRSHLKVLAVEAAGPGEVGLVLAGVAAARFRFGDEVTHVELP